MPVAQILQQTPRTASSIKHASFWRASASAIALLLLSSISSYAQTNVLTQHYDNSRTGGNVSETTLTPANIVNTVAAPNNFGKLFSVPVDGRLFAQPLYVSGLTMGAGTPQAGTVHNVVFVATEHDSVYAFDADSKGGINGAPLWQVTLFDTAHGVPAGVTATSVPNSDLSTNDIVPEIGVTGTPVIDLATKTMYLIGKTKENGNYVQRLHALDITTGKEKLGGPVALSGQVNGNGSGSSGGVLKWDVKWENNRPGLLLLNGFIYVGFGSHGDNGPWHGWILAYNAATLQQTSVWCSSPTGSGSGVWMSGSGLAADTFNNGQSPSGRIFIPTGNGSFDTAHTPPLNYGDDLIRLDLNNGAMSANDSFTPLNQGPLNNADEDVASGGILLLPDQASGGHTHLLMQVGKEGRIYIVDRDNMGGYNAGVDNIVQEVPVNNSGQTNQNYKMNGLWSMPTYWNGNIFVWGNGDRLKAFSFANGRLGNLDANSLPNPTSTSSEGSGFPGSTPVVSSNGTTNGIVWDVKTDTYNNSAPNNYATLYAHDANNVATTLFDSSQNNGRDNPGISTKFVVPVVANGKVYVGTAGQLSVYGLLGGAQQTATPVITPGSKGFTGTISVTITDATAGAAIYYTTDGSMPTTLSTKYSGAISVSTTETVTAIASATNFLQSSPASASYTLQTQTLAPYFTPAAGSYNTVQMVTIADDTTNATIYYTVDGSTPMTTSKVYTAPLAISSTTTLKALATSPTLTPSPVTTGIYTVVVGGSGIDFSVGFSSALNTMTFNGSTDLADTRLQLTNGNVNEAGSAWFDTPVNITAFTNDFTFQLANPNADGFTFAIQNSGTTALGPTGGGLGYGSDAVGGAGGIPNSIAIKFDLYSNNGEGGDSTGLYQNGASPTTPSIDLTNSGIDLHSGDTFSVHMVYNGTTLTMTITDGVTNAAYTTSWPINIAQVIGSNTAYVGFTGGTGGLTASQKIESWTFVSTGNVAPQASMPSFTPPGGTYMGTQTVKIADTTTGASIFYSTDGSAPALTAGGSTQLYSGALTVTGNETIKAIATAPNFSPSVVGTAVYAIEQTATAPIFSPAAGSYASAQMVTITTPTPLATIYYTTNGMTPTTSSTQYTAPISVSATETIQAIAAASGYFTSSVSSATFTIVPSVTSLNLSGGFTPGSVTLNGNATLNGTHLRITDGNGNEASSAWFTSPINISAFTTDFSMQSTPGTNPLADGMTFAIQGTGPTALGPFGGGLGYGPDNPGVLTGGIQQSVAIKFDLYSNAGEPADSTGLYINGASPTTPAVDLTNTGIDLHSGHLFKVHITYDGTTLVLAITDSTTNAVFSTSFPVNIPAAVGANTAYVGFTGGTGGLTAIQDVISWTMSTNLGAAATPTSTPAPGSYVGPQTVTITSTTPGAKIFYTLDGSIPATTVGGSTLQYSTGVSITATKTLNAIAIASGFSPSAIGNGTYTILNQAATPVFSLPAGSYPNAQQVTITDSTPSSTIYYTTDGSAPTTNSKQYTGPVTISVTTTLNAIAALNGAFSSTPASVQYIIGTAVNTLNLSGGFTAGSVTLNGNAALNGSKLRITDGAVNEASSAWFTSPVNITAFTTDFYTQVTAGTNPLADGMTFAIQGDQPNAIGPSGGGLGYGPDTPPGTPGIAKSVAVKFDLYSNYGETANSTGLYTNGASPTVPFVDLTNSGVDPHTGNVMHVHIAYDGTVLTLTITDTVTSATFTTTFPVNIPATVGGNTAYVGFTGGTGGLTAIQDVLNWTMQTVQPVAGTPVFNPAGGSFPYAQSVSITSATPNATIYYTTDGSAPMTTSTKYTGAFTVASTKTIKAIATATGATTSPVSSATFTIIPAVTSLNLSNGFTAGAMTLNGSATINGTRLRLTDGGVNEAASAWYASPVNIQQFTSDFSFQQTPVTTPPADGFTFTIQGGAPTALGPSGGGLGYGPDNPAGAPGIGSSVAIKFDLYGNAGETPDSTGFYVNGASPTIPFVDLTNTGINFSTGHVFKAHATYDGAILSVTFTDTVTLAAFTTNFPVNIPAMIGGNSAYVGFTGGTGGSTATQDIISWTMSSQAPAATPVISPAGGTFATAQVVTITDSTPGAVIHYTADGSTPTASSPTYAGSLTVTASATIKAIAIASNYSNSGIAVNNYIVTVGVGATTLVGSSAVSASPDNNDDGLAEAFQTTASSSGTVTTLSIYIDAGTTATQVLVGLYADAGGNPGALLTQGTMTQFGANSFNSVAVAPVNVSVGTKYWLAIMGVGGVLNFRDGTQAGCNSQVSGDTGLTAFEATWAQGTTYSNSCPLSAFGAGVQGSPQVAAPTFTPNGGTFTTTQNVTIMDATTGSTIYYAINGTPTTSSTLYNGAISLSSTETISAIAVKTGYSNSPVASATFTFTASTAATPTFTPAAGTYTKAQSVTLADTTPGAAIYYTTNGSNPTNLSTKYTVAIPVAATTTIKAIAYATGFTNSAIASATYTITVAPPTTLLGTTTIQSVADNDSAGNAEAFPVTASASGVLNTLTAYVDAGNAATQMVIGIYSNNSGHPGTLLTQGTSAKLTSSTWTTVTVPSVTITTGTKYWIAVLGTGGQLNFRDGTQSGCTSETSTQTTLKALPTTWSTGDTWPNSCPLSSYGSH